MINKEAFKNRILIRMGKPPYTWGREKNIGRGVIQKILKGIIPDPPNLIKLANALVVTVDWLLTGKEPFIPQLEDVEKECRCLPLVEGYLSCGDGAIPDDRIKEWLWIPKKFLEFTAAPPNRYAIIEVKGDSMETVLQNKELVVVDRFNSDIKNIKKGSVYAVRRDNENTVKYLHHIEKDNLLELISANLQWARDHGFEYIKLNEVEENPIIGKVVLSFRRWR